MYCIVSPDGTKFLEGFHTCNGPFTPNWSTFPKKVRGDGSSQARFFNMAVFITLTEVGKCLDEIGPCQVLTLVDFQKKCATEWSTQ